LFKQQNKGFSREVELTPILNQNTTPARVTPMPTRSLYPIFVPSGNVPTTLPPNPFMSVQPTLIQSPAVHIQGVNMTNYSGPPPTYNIAKNTIVPTSLENLSSSHPKLYPTLEPKLDNTVPIQSQQKSHDKALQENNKKDNSKKTFKR